MSPTSPQLDSSLQMKEQNLAAASFAPRVRDTMPVPLIKNMNKKLPGLEARQCIFVESESCLGTTESENSQRGRGEWWCRERMVDKEEGERAKHIRELLNHPVVLGSCMTGL